MWCLNQILVREKKRKKGVFQLMNFMFDQVERLKNSHHIIDGVPISDKYYLPVRCCVVANHLIQLIIVSYNSNFSDVNYGI